MLAEMIFFVNLSHFFGIIQGFSNAYPKVYLIIIYLFVSFNEYYEKKFLPIKIIINEESINIRIRKNIKLHTKI